MNIYKLSADAFVMGDHPDPVYGYSYRAFTYDSDFPLQWSSKQQGFVKDVQIVAETADKKTAKSSGNEYLWLTKVKIAETEPSLKENWDNRNTDPAIPAETQVAPTPQKLPSFKSSHTNNAYLKDVSNIPQFVWSKLLDHWDIRSMSKDVSEAAAFWQAVQYHSDELLRMIDHVRGVESEDPFPSEDPSGR